MNTYQALTLSATTIATDLQLFFELHDHSYCNDFAFTERWGGYIKELVCDRLWAYGGAVFDKELGWEKFEIDGVEQTLSNALAEFGRVCDPEDPKKWWNGFWCELIKCEDCEEFGVSISEDGEMDCSPCGTMEFCSDCHERRYFWCDDCDSFRTRDVISTDGEYCVDCHEVIRSKLERVLKEAEAFRNEPDCEECETCGEVILRALMNQVSSDCFVCEECFKDDDDDDELADKPRKTYKCRVECPADIDRVVEKMKMVSDERAYFITTKIHAEPMDFGSGPITLPDREWTFTTIQDLEDVRAIFRLVEDLHVGLQTVQLEADYTGERDYDLE